MHFFCPIEVAIPVCLATKKYVELLRAIMFFFDSYNQRQLGVAALNEIISACHTCILTSADRWIVAPVMSPVVVIITE